MTHLTLRTICETLSWSARSLSGRDPGRSSRTYILHNHTFQFLYKYIFLNKGSKNVTSSQTFSQHLQAFCLKNTAELFIVEVKTKVSEPGYFWLKQEPSLRSGSGCRGHNFYLYKMSQIKLINFEHVYLQWKTTIYIFTFIKKYFGRKTVKKL